MPNTVTMSAAKKFMNKIEGAVIPLAVFSNGCGGWTNTRINTEHFKEQYRKHPEFLVGVYTNDITLPEIYDDFEYVGIR